MIRQKCVRVLLLLLLLSIVAIEGKRQKKIKKLYTPSKYVEYPVTKLKKKVTVDYVPVTTYKKTPIKFKKIKVKKGRKEYKALEEINPTVSRIKRQLIGGYPAGIGGNQFYAGGRQLVSLGGAGSLGGAYTGGAYGGRIITGGSNFIGQGAYGQSNLLYLRLRRLFLLQNRRIRALTIRYRRLRILLRRLSRRQRQQSNQPFILKLPKTKSSSSGEKSKYKYTTTDVKTYVVPNAKGYSLPSSGSSSAGGALSGSGSSSGTGSSSGSESKKVSTYLPAPQRKRGHRGLSLDEESEEGLLEGGFEVAEGFNTGGFKNNDPNFFYYYEEDPELAKSQYQFVAEDAKPEDEISRRSDATIEYDIGPYNGESIDFRVLRALFHEVKEEVDRAIPEDRKTKTARDGRQLFARRSGPAKTKAKGEEGDGTITNEIHGLRKMMEQNRRIELRLQRAIEKLLKEIHDQGYDLGDIDLEEYEDYETTATSEEQEEEV